MVGKKAAKGPTEPLNMELPRELVQRFKDVAHWHDIGIAEAGEAAILMYIRAKEDEIEGAYTPRPGSERRRKTDPEPTET